MVNWGTMNIWKTWTGVTAVPLLDHVNLYANLAVFMVVGTL